MTSPTEQQLSSLSEVQWEDLFKRLLMFTHKRYGWLKELSGWDLQDIVQQAIIDTLDGKWRWPPKDSQTAVAQNLSLFLFLCNVIRNDVSHLREMERRKSRKEVHELDLHLERPLLEESEVSDKDLLERRAAFLSNQNSESNELENLPGPNNGFASAEATSVARVLYPLAEGEQELIDLIDAVAIFGCRKREDLADLLAVSPQEITKRQKRLRSLYHELSERIHEAAVDDQELTKVVDLLPHAPDSRPKEIAEQLGLSARQMYGILKRLRRQLTTMEEEAING
jgi:CRP-like cAMP-binding protein